MKKNSTQFISLLLLAVFAINLLFGIKEVFAFYQDREDSFLNNLLAGSLDFSLISPDDFLPQVNDTQNATRNIEVVNNGSLGFQYQVTASELSGNLCEYLEIKDDLDNVFQPLETYISSVTTFNTKNTWLFTLQVEAGAPNLNEEACSFKFIYDGWQEGPFNIFEGFHDREEILNNVSYAQSFPPSTIVINEVLYDVLEPHQGKEKKNEWVEVYNNSDQTINLKNWSFINDNYIEIIHANTYIAPGEYIVFSHDEKTCVQLWNCSGAQHINLGGSIQDGWFDNEGDYVILRDPSGQDIDFVAWEGGYEGNYPLWPISADEGWSIARIIAGVDTDVVDDWEVLGDDLGESPNPGTNPHTVVLNEFLPNPAGETFGEDEDLMPQGEWVELYNYGSLDINVGDWKIVDGAGGVLTINPDNTNTGSTIVLAGEWLVVYRNGYGDFELRNEGDTINLLDENDNILDTYTYSEPAPENKSYARIPDGSSNWVDPIPTPGGPNVLEEIIESEILVEEIDIPEEVLEIVPEEFLDVIEELIVVEEIITEDEVAEETESVIFEEDTNTQEGLNNIQENE